MDLVVDILIGIIIAATPLVFAAIGELVAEKSGVLNLGVEGMMIVGAIAGFATAIETGSFIAGVIAAIVCAALLGNSLLLRFLEIAIVNSDGAPASRLRVLLRNAVLWSLVLLALSLLMLASVFDGPRMLFLLIIYGIVLLFTSDRAPHDMIAGTWLVPR